MIGILIFFAFILVLVLAFSSSKKETRVRKIDPETGKETIEIHESTSPSAAQTAARGTIWIVGIIILIILVTAALMSH